MKKEGTMTLVILLVLTAISVCFRQIFLKPLKDIWDFSYIAVLITAGTFLLALFGLFVRRLLSDNE